MADEATNIIINNTNIWEDPISGRSTNRTDLIGSLLDPKTHCLKCRTKLIDGACYNIECGEMDAKKKRKVMEKKDMILSKAEADKIAEELVKKGAKVIKVTPEEAKQLAK